MTGFAPGTFTAVRLLNITAASGVHFLLFLAVIGGVPVLAQDQGAWTLTHTRDYLQSPGGIPRWAECELSVRVSKGKGQASNRCVDNTEERRGVAAQRDLTPAEVTRIIELAQASNLSALSLSSPASKGSPPETLTITCCARAEVVVFETLWNPFFKQGPRRELVELLRGWRRELIGIAQELRKKR